MRLLLNQSEVISRVFLNLYLNQRGHGNRKLALTALLHRWFILSGCSSLVLALERSPEPFYPSSIQQLIKPPEHLKLPYPALISLPPMVNITQPWAVSLPSQLQSGWAKKLRL
jgi:hypothetical protein